jgi:4-hydroxybenzoate polyprenyltransferase
VNDSALPTDAVPLCLDIAGTLTPANLRIERAIRAFKEAPPLLGWLLRRRRARRASATHASHAAGSDSAAARSLPFNAEVLNWLRQQRSAGQRLVLLADGDPQLAEQIAEHLGLFDEIASTAGTGSTSERKRRALVERFGEHGFDYAGSDAADMIVWEASRAALVVGDRSLSERVALKTRVLRFFPASRPTLRTWIKAIRLHQWVKNALVFLPALLAHRIGEPAVMLESAMAFAAFGCCASSVYVTNDLFDLASDREHPRKRRRPFAAALLSVRSGIIAACILLLCASLLAAVIGIKFALVLACYYVVTWAYSLRLKRLALLDVMTLAGLYTLRIISGSAATHIELSFWLLAFSVFLFLSLGFVKRYAELYDSRKAGKLHGHGRGYGPDDLALIMSLGTAAGYSAVVVIALYINSVDSIALYHHHKTMWLICPLMLFWISRVWMLTARGQMHDDPVVFAMRDRTSLLVVGALGLIVLWAI